MIGLKLISLVYILVVVNGQEYQDYQQSARQAPLRLSNSGNSDAAPAPIAILKQINKHNEDGSYTYGYEGADGSFKIETKLATGDVKGKYGYVDETGKVRVVEYGANKYGFQPSGEGITVAPPTLVDETTNKDRPQVDYDDEQPAPQQRPYVARSQSRPQSARPQYSAPPPPPPQQQQRYQPQQQQQYNDYDDQPQQQAPQPKYTSAPVPQRAQIPGAVPIDVVYSARPRPARPDPEYVQKQTFSSGPLSQSPIRFSNPQPVQQSFAPAPQPAYSAPRQQPQQQQQQQQQQQYRPSSGRSPSVLDQLAKDFALPQGGSAPLHDISFGYY